MDKNVIRDRREKQIFKGKLMVKQVLNNDIKSDTGLMLILKKVHGPDFLKTV